MIGAVEATSDRQSNPSTCRFIVFLIWLDGEDYGAAGGEEQEERVDLVFSRHPRQSRAAETGELMPVFAVSGQF
jgi:hypothetical protein